MKFLRISFLSLLTFAGLLLIFSAMLPSRLEVTHSVVVNAPKDVVYAQIARYENWSNWMPWLNNSSRAKEISISGQDGRAGSRLYCSSIGKWIGPTEITRGHVLLEGQISETIYFPSLDQEMEDVWQFEQAPEGVKVTWVNKASFPMYMRIAGRFYLKPYLEKQYADGLEQMKAYLEAQAMLK